MNAHDARALSFSMSLLAVVHDATQERALLFYSSTLPVPNRAIPSPCIAGARRVVCLHRRVTTELEQSCARRVNELRYYVRI